MGSATILALALALAPGTVGGAPSSDDVAALVARAKQAAGAGEFEAALADFERAQALAPSAAIEFNIAVCHHTLMLGASDPAHREHHRSAAIAAYRGYLELDPAASDRAQTEEIIAELGPAPETPSETPVELGPPPALRAVVTRLQPADAPTVVDPPSDPPVRQPPPAQPERPRFPRGRVGPFVPLVLAQMARLLDARDVAHLPQIGLGVRGGAFLGPRSRVNVGAEISGALQPTGTRSRHTLWSGQLLATFEYGASVVASGRFAIAGGAVVGFAGESLRHRGRSTLTCRLRDSGEITSRAGFVIGPRLALLLLLGKRRNHELGLRVTPALTAYGGGKATEPGGSCDERPFAQAGLPAGAALVTTIDLGYAPRL